jgi:hypothetical protein
MSKVRTPGSVISASVLMFIYGSLLLMCGTCGGVAIAMQPQNDPMGVQAMLEKEAPGHFAVSIATPVFNTLFGFMFIASGIGVLRLVRLFRVTAYLACAGILLTTIAQTTYTAIFIMPVQQRLIMQQMQNPNNPPMPANMNMNMIMTGSMAFGILLVLVIHVAFCLPTVILLSVKSAREAFAGIGPEPDDDDPYAIRRRPRRDEDSEDDDDEPVRRPSSRGDTGITDRGP